jgi:hypothetical protein
MSWLTAIGSALMGFFSALPKIIDEIAAWRKSQDIRHEQQVAKEVDQVTKETENAKTEDEQRKVASRWASIIKRMRR